MFPNLKAEMARLGLKVEQVAEGVGKKKEWLENRLSGKSGLPIDVAFTIRDKFFKNVDFTYLFSQTAIIPFKEQEESEEE